MGTSFAEERLEFLPDGDIRFEFRDPGPDGATRAIFRPIEFLETLAARIPPPPVPHGPVPRHLRPQPPVA